MSDNCPMCQGKPSSEIKVRVLLTPLPKISMDMVTWMSLVALLMSTIWFTLSANSGLPVEVFYIRWLWNWSADFFSLLIPLCIVASAGQVYLFYFRIQKIQKSIFRNSGPPQQLGRTVRTVRGSRVLSTSHV